MHKYKVIQSRECEKWLALLGSGGCYHIARALSRAPPIGAVLDGTRPHLGFGMLMCPRSGHTYRVMFETINEALPPPAVHAVAQSGAGTLSAPQPSLQHPTNKTNAASRAAVPSSAVTTSVSTFDGNGGEPGHGRPPPMA
ncbi:hypothetical protein ACPOLB_25745 [Rubrivivax sp. RP6-9]|uniref:hypothetical protein n=1 Tax=Rubrivivax sp. RP6-9 TaxID=3415750 RepID=UPI003CC59030